MIVPDMFCSGAYDAPLSTPAGARSGCTNGDRIPRAVVTMPGTAVGSGGTTTAVVSVAAAAAGPCASSR